MASGPGRPSGPAELTWVFDQNKAAGCLVESGSGSDPLAGAFSAPSPQRWCVDQPLIVQSVLISGPNTIEQGSFLTLHYRLSGADGTALVNTFGGKPATLTIGAGQLAAAMEQHLIGLTEGSSASFTLAPGEAFGDRNPDLLQRVKLGLLRELGDPDARYQAGDAVQFPTPDGSGNYAGVVQEVGPDWLLFDFNHPLAGKAVVFDVQLIGVM